MGAADRTVQHLHLRAPSAQAAVRAAQRLEDALRCASLPDSGERLLLVRQLHLGRLPTGLSSQSLSLLIEQRVQAAGGHWVHGEQASAADSRTVFFASRLQAAQAAVRRRAEGRHLAEWYWRLALPGVLPGASDQVFLHSVVTVLARETTAPVSLPALVADIVTAGHTPWLVRHASEETLRCLLSIASVQRQLLVMEREWAATSRHQPMERRSGHATLRPEVFNDRSAVAPDRSSLAGLQAPVWVHAVLRAANGETTSALVAFTTALPESLTSPEAPAYPQRETGQALPVTAGTTAISGTPRMPPPASADGVRDKQRPALRQMHERLLAAADKSAGPIDALAPLTPVPFGELALTGVGGLLFLIPVLERLGFGEWQQRHADRPLAGCVLRQVLQRLRVPAHDAAWALVASLPTPPVAPPGCWETPALWTDERIAMAHDPDNPLTASEMARRWQVACSRYLCRVARIGLARLCLRQAHMTWSATHLDTRFALADVDLRVRRAALDVDPGWVDWLPRVVRFEYTHGGLP